MTQTVLQPTQLEFLHQLQEAWQQQQFQRLIFSQYQGVEADLVKVSAVPVALKNELQIKVVYRYRQKDITKNYSWSEFWRLCHQYLTEYLQFNLFVLSAELQLKNKKKQWNLIKKQQTTTEQAHLQIEHNREKKRWIAQDAIFLQALGITDKQQQLIPAMARKWKQINKFVEIFAHALQHAQLEQQSNLHVVDFGSGKGYLTCAVYDYLDKLQRCPQVTGVELRNELVQFCQNVAQQSNFGQLHFFQGDVRSFQPEQTDVMIALHACDIATDYAIHTGIRLGAKVIMCAPCCHKELRPQLHAPEVLKPMLEFGVHAGQQAEMLTDSLRALLLQAYGYNTKILEFVSLEHTSKNKMILATRHKGITAPDQHILKQVQALKKHYAINHQTLESLLLDLPLQPHTGCAD